MPYHNSCRFKPLPVLLLVAAACSPLEDGSSTASDSQGSTTAPASATEAVESTTGGASSTSTDPGTTAATGGCPVDPCGVMEYCDWGANSCGAGASTRDHGRRGDEPRCEPRPTARECGAGESSVCGCDGQIYASECHAAAAGVDVDASGGCTPPPGTFACGYRLCDLGGSYCRIILVDGASDPDVYGCSALPPGCGDAPSCACILEAEACPWTQCYDEGSHFQTTCPQG